MKPPLPCHLLRDSYYLSVEPNQDLANFDAIRSTHEAARTVALVASCVKCVTSCPGKIVWTFAELPVTRWEEGWSAAPLYSSLN